MKQQHADYQVAPYPKYRRWTAAAYRSVRSRPMIHALIEVDVTKPRAVLRTHKAQTGESLSFTAFLTACLAKAVDEHKAVQAVRQGRKRLVIFEDVDVWIPIEHDAAGTKLPLPYIVRAANRQSFRAIHDEIRAAQVAEDVEHAGKGPRFIPAALFGPFLWLLWRIGRARPRLQKRSGGTVCITAVGMFGKGAGWGIPGPFPMPLMLTVGGIGEKQSIVDGQVATRDYLSLTISVDHNIVDGAPAARFTRRLKELIESGYGLGDVTATVKPELAGADGTSTQQVEATRHALCSAMSAG
jgi:pyruvate/2-oxoglutarate dehydrogenase complex dihydrolipoamide acyltransferase (E2) component